MIGRFQSVLFVSYFKVLVVVRVMIDCSQKWNFSKDLNFRVWIIEKCSKPVVTIIVK